MAKTNPIGVRFDQEKLDYLKKEHSVESPQKALVFYERFFGQHHKLAKDVKSPLREEKKFPKSDSEVKEEGRKRNDSQNYKELSEYDLSALKGRSLVLQDELKNPPKNPLIGIKAWKMVRENELKE